MLETISENATPPIAIPPPSVYWCIKCHSKMLDDETWLRVKKENGRENEYNVYCKQCVEGDKDLTDQSNYMCRYLVSQLLATCTQEEIDQMREEFKTERPADYDIIQDLFDLVVPMEVISVKEVPPTEDIKTE